MNPNTPKKGGVKAASRRYAEKLLDPRWQKKRLQVFERDHWMCQTCGETEQTLHVHHARYSRTGNPWDSPDEDLVTLCEFCHSGFTDWLPEAQKLWYGVLYSYGGGNSVHRGLIKGVYARESKRDVVAMDDGELFGIVKARIPDKLCGVLFAWTKNSRSTLSFPLTLTNSVIEEMAMSVLFWWHEAINRNPSLYEKVR